MAIARRFLPSTTLLCSFEASARHKSFTAAANELCLTQSAVSRHIRALEVHLGAELFVRDRQAVFLTKAGEAYAREICEALHHISAATLAFRANPIGGTVNLGVLPTLSTQWLIPKLGGFKALHPNITVNLYTRLQPFEFSGENLDAAIHFGEAEWPGAEISFLMEDRVIPVCSPSLFEKIKSSKCNDLATVPLLHLVSRPDAWERWFEAQKIYRPSLHGPLFDQFSFVVSAALYGDGVALIPQILIERELKNGQLFELPANPLESEGSYYLVNPTSRGLTNSFMIFKKWLLAN